MHRIPLSKRSTTALESDRADAEYALTLLTPGNAAYTRAEGRITDLLAELHRRAAYQEVCHVAA